MKTKERKAKIANGFMSRVAISKKITVKLPVCPE